MTTNPREIKPVLKRPGRTGRNSNYSDNDEIKMKQIAADLAKQSFVTQALSHYIEQVLEFAYDYITETQVTPLRKERDSLARRVSILEAQFSMGDGI